MIGTLEFDFIGGSLKSVFSFGNKLDGAERNLPALHVGLVNPNSSELSVIISYFARFEISLHQ